MSAAELVTNQYNADGRRIIREVVVQILECSVDGCLEETSMKRDGTVALRCPEHTKTAREEWNAKMAERAEAQLQKRRMVVTLIEVGMGEALKAYWEAVGCKPEDAPETLTPNPIGEGEVFIQIKGNTSFAYRAKEILSAKSSEEYKGLRFYAAENRRAGDIEAQMAAGRAWVQYLKEHGLAASIVTQMS